MKLTPGIYPSISIDDYVFDRLCETPTLSSSVANVILDRSLAHARLKHARFNPAIILEQDFSRPANFGSAVHAMVFGGSHIVVIDADGYTTKEAKGLRDRTLMDSGIPLLREEHLRATAIADVVTRALVDLTKQELEFEHTVIFKHGPTWCRSRPDAMTADRRLIVDLKVTGTNARDANRQFFSQGYDLQAAFLERAADSLDEDGMGKREIIYLFVESEPPFAYSMLQVSEGTLSIARKKMHAAVNLWDRALRKNEWPTYQSSRTLTERPSWDESAWLNREMTDPAIKVEEAA